MQRPTTTITVIEGDGIGPEIMSATLRILDAAGAQLAYDRQLAGAKVFLKGLASGVTEDTLASIEQHRIVLKGPLETPIGYGEKSANVTLRKYYETYANIRPVKELPGIKTPFSGRGIDLVVVRENVEDLYAGIEHMQTPTVAQCLKLMSQPGCDRIVRMAFALAKSEGRSKVHCATKANIMKLTEGLLKSSFEQVAKEYSDITAEHILIDNCAHQLVRYPEAFQVIVMSNMNGDIISDLTSGLIGGLGLAPSANLGQDIAMFEAVHGSAPDLTGKNCANPTALLQSAMMMLRYMQRQDVAERIEQALHQVLADGQATCDIRRDGLTTTAFTDAIVAQLEGAKAPVGHSHKAAVPLTVPKPKPIETTAKIQRRVGGVDIFVESQQAPKVLAQQLEACAQSSALQLKMISNRGTKVYPHHGRLPDCVDHFRCRFVAKDPQADLSDGDILTLLQALAGKVWYNHLEKLQWFDGKAAYTKAQGED